MEQVINGSDIIIIAGRQELAGSQKIALETRNTLKQANYKVELIFTRKAFNEGRKIELGLGMSRLSVVVIARLMFKRDKLNLLVHGNVPLIVGILLRYSRATIGRKTTIINYCHGLLYNKLSGITKLIAQALMNALHKQCINLTVCEQDTKYLTIKNHNSPILLPNFLPVVVSTKRETYSKKNKSKNAELNGAVILRSSVQKGSDFAALNQTKINSALEKNNAYLTIVDNDHFKCSTENIKQVGWIDFANDIANYDYFISFSKYESHPLAVMEAICNNVPVFLSNIEAHNEFELPSISYFDHIDFFDKFGKFISYVRTNNRELTQLQKESIMAKYPSKNQWSRRLKTEISSIIK